MTFKRDTNHICYVCLKPLARLTSREVVLEDDNHAHVHVGPDCFERVIKSGYDGVRSGKGKGPMVFATTQMAQAYARRTAGEAGQAKSVFASVSHLLLNSPVAHMKTATKMIKVSGQQVHLNAESFRRRIVRLEPEMMSEQCEGCGRDICETGHYSNGGWMVKCDECGAAYDVVDSSVTQ